MWLMHRASNKEFQFTSTISSHVYYMLWFRIGLTGAYGNIQEFVKSMKCLYTCIAFFLTCEPADSGWYSLVKISCCLAVLLFLYCA